MRLIANTDRLMLRHIAPLDAAFYRELVNEPAWIANIGDRQVKSLDDAKQQIISRLMASYQQYGFGMYLVTLQSINQPVGLCGLVKRDILPAPDIGFAILQAYWRCGYALEAAQAVLHHTLNELHLKRVFGITTITNEPSARLLLKLGMQFQGQMKWGEETRELYQTKVGAEVADSVAQKFV